MDELATYIIKYYRHLMTPEESAAFRSMFGEAKVQGTESPELKKRLREWLISKDERMLELLADVAR